MKGDSKKKKDKKDRPPIQDGWIELSPGSKVVLDEQSSKDWQREVEKIKNIRGRVLAVCIQLELQLDALLRTLFFPTNVLKADEAKTGLKVDDLSLLFLYEIVKNLRFNEKCKVFKALTAEHNFLEDRDHGALLRKLDKARKIRNLFAHSAISFLPIEKTSPQKFRAEGYSEGKRIVIDEKFISDCEKLFSDTLQLLTDLQKNVSRIGLENKTMSK